MSDGLALLQIPGWLLFVGTPLAMLFWILRRFFHKPRLPVWPGVLGLLIWIAFLVVFGFSVLVGMGGHTPASFELATSIIALGLFGGVIWNIWYLYWKLGTP